MEKEEIKYRLSIYYKVQMMQWQNMTPQDMVLILANKDRHLQLLNESLPRMGDYDGPKELVKAITEYVIEDQLRHKARETLWDFISIYMD